MKNELFVYYRVDMAVAETVAQRVFEFQRTLESDVPGLQAKAMRRSMVTDGPQTWMEVYSVDSSRYPSGIDASLAALIEERAAVVSRWIDGTRTRESFCALASPRGAD